jgi:hypothetical protein
VIGKDCKVCHDQGLKQYPSDGACLKCHDVDELAKKTARSGEDRWQNPHDNLHYGKDLPCAEESPDDLDKNHQVKVDAHLVM